ncbi:hypothetical protein V6259_12985 [Marinomonas sp. TI.3.20]|uniref:hypothetical protein n=1 Tax=Marinomonas sp. TI.3.20 TaxID=3121296 RepID=UPI00311E00F2
MTFEKENISSDGVGFIPQTREKIDLFRRHKQLAKLSAESKPLTPDLHLITEDGVELNMPGISYFMASHEWNGVNLGEQLRNALNASGTGVTTHEELVSLSRLDTPESKALVDTLEGLTLMSNTLKRLSSRDDEVLEQFKNENLLAPSNTIQQYSEILAKSAEELKDFLTFDLEFPSNEIDKSENLKLMTTGLDIGKYVEKAKKQNVELVLNHTKYNQDKLTDLLRNVTTTELASHPTLIGPVMYSEAALKQENKQLFELAFEALKEHTDLTTSNMLSTLSSSAREQLKVSAYNSIAQALSSIATHNYGNLSDSNKAMALDHINKLLSTKTKQVVGFQKNLHDTYEEIDDNILFQEYCRELMKPMTTLEAKQMGDGTHKTINEINSRIHFSIENPTVDPTDIAESKLAARSPIIRR